jgi:hypothetical protein
MTKVIAQIPVRLDDKRIEAGETIEVEKALADALIESGRFKSAKTNNKKKKDEIEEA